MKETELLYEKVSYYMGRWAIVKEGEMLQWKVDGICPSRPPYNPRDKFSLQIST